MFCQYQYYRYNTEQLQTAVDHSDEKYQCKKMSDCPYIGTTVVNKIPWGDWPVGESDQSDDSDSASDASSQHSRSNQDQDEPAEESDTSSEEDREGKGREIEISEWRKKLELIEEKDEALEEAGLEINKLRREVETLTSENKRLMDVLDIVNKISSEGKAGQGDQVFNIKFQEERETGDAEEQTVRVPAIAP